jgi:DNA polymerase-3 subunit delta
MQANLFLKSADAEKIPNVLLLVGPEGYFRRRVISKIAKLLLPDGEDDVGLERLDAEVASPVHILDSAASGSLLAGRRVIAVRGAEALKTKPGEPAFDALEAYVKSPNPAVTLILEAEELERRHPLWKLAGSGAETIECDPLKGADLRGWITSYARERGYALPPPAASLVEELLGSDLMMIKNALDKVMLFCGERKQIEYEDLESSLSVAREHAIWEMTNAIGSRNAAAAISALGRLLDEGKHPLQISFSLQLQFRQLLMVKEMLDRRVPHEKVASIAKLGRWSDRLFRQARLFTAADLRSIHRWLFELEDSIKSAGVDERFLLEYIVYRICRSGGGTPAADRSA